MDILHESITETKSICKSVQVNPFSNAICKKKAKNKSNQKQKGCWRESVKVIKQHNEYSDDERASAVTSIVGSTLERKSAKKAKCSADQCLRHKRRPYKEANQVAEQIEKNEKKLEKREMAENYNGN